MAKGKRMHRAHQSGLKGVPQRIDHYRVLVLRAQGLSAEEIATAVGASVASVYRFLAKPKK